VSYNYQTERPKLFTEEGQVLFLKIRDNVKSLLKEAGAFTGMKAWKGCAGSTWEMQACLDRLIELEELRRCKEDCYQQDWVYTGF